MKVVQLVKGLFVPVILILSTSLLSLETQTVLQSNLRKTNISPGLGFEISQYGRSFSRTDTAFGLDILRTRVLQYS